MTEPAAGSTLLRVVPLAWLALSVAWLVGIFVTELPALTLVIWIAITVGPIAALEHRNRRPSIPSRQG